MLQRLRAVRHAPCLLQMCKLLGVLCGAGSGRGAGHQCHANLPGVELRERLLEEGDALNHLPLHELPAVHLTVAGLIACAQACTMGRPLGLQNSKVCCTQDQSRPVSSASGAELSGVCKACLWSPARQCQAS